MSFKSLGLKDALLKAVEEKGYTKPSVIQEKAIPLVLSGHDVLASAQTGTGKTAGFTLPILQLISDSPTKHRRPIRALILTPTRELAAQIYENVMEYSIFLDIKSTVIFGGVNANPQIKVLKEGVDILIATPGRLLDLENQRKLSLSQVDILVLDEADRMLDMGFLRDIKHIINLLPERRQNLLFSATFSKEIKVLAGSFLNNPKLVEATPQNTTVDKIVQKVYPVDKGRKTDLIIKLIKDGNWRQVLVFTRTKHGANNLCKKMMQKGIAASAIHGNKTQNARTKALAGFKDGSVHVLVATDIAARGLDIPLLPHVVNYELPNISEDYVHRIGRTGRAGASGEAISLLSLNERSYLVGIEKLVGIKIPRTIIQGFEPIPESELSAEELQPPHIKKFTQRGGRNQSNSSNHNRSRNNNSKSGGANKNKKRSNNSWRKKN